MKGRNGSYFPHSWSLPHLWWKHGLPGKRCCDLSPNRPRRYYYSGLENGSWLDSYQESSDFSPIDMNQQILQPTCVLIARVEPQRWVCRWAMINPEISVLAADPPAPQGNNLSCQKCCHLLPSQRDSNPQQECIHEKSFYECATSVHTTGWTPIRS